MRPLNSILLLIGIIVILALDFFFIRNLLLQFESRNYPNTTGLITRSAVTSKNTMSRTGSGYASHTSYGVDLAYHFEVNGQPFEGTHLRYTKMFSTHDWAEQQVAARPVGLQVRVFYNPQNPADSVLIAGIDSSDQTLFVVLALFNLLAVFFGWCLVKNISKPPASGASGLTAKDFA